MRARKFLKSARECGGADERAAAAAYNELLRAGQIVEEPDPKDKRSRLATDKRTTTDADGHPHITPFYVGAVNLFIVCPYCGEVHTHGSGGAGFDYTGFRTPHCARIVGKPQYMIEREKGE